MVTKSNIGHNVVMKINQGVKNKISKKIGIALKHFRDKKNLSQEALAFEIGVDRTYISALENGTKCASVYCLFMLSKTLDVPLKEFLDIEIKI